MIDPRLLRSDPSGVVAALGRRGVPREEVEHLVWLDSQSRGATSDRDLFRGEINRLSKDVGRARREGDLELAESLQTQSRELGDKVKELERQAEQFSKQLRDVLLVTPNLPSDDAPDGDGPEDNVVLRGWAPGGQPADGDDWAEHQRVAHWDIGAELGILDFERGAKLSGSMFPLWRGEGARLLRVLTQWALDRHRGRWEEIRPPTLVLRSTMEATGHLPKFEEDMYELKLDDLFLIPTAEVPLTSMARDEILAVDALPLRYCAYTPCFRREAGSAGRDTRGLLRSHEFDKVELMAVCTAEQAQGIFDEILLAGEQMLQELGLTYRVVDLCAGDLGLGSRRTFDLEVYAPGVGAWLEVSSVSSYGDYQARRANIRHRAADGGGGTVVAHTLNGSALAWPRVVAAALETHRQPDGSVDLPVFGKIAAP